ncbi:hypothetical protein BDF21DRAFT_482750 [Thamnidium elegans]|nr:hypothetical protein BDF21DRAFT_482750 [Thamnidium elegans]
MGPKVELQQKETLKFLDYKFRNNLCIQERKMKESEKHLVMFISDRGTGVGSTIKEYHRYGGTWKQPIHYMHYK